MELRQLEYLVAVVDDGGFTRAAQRLHVAQPGVSAQMRRLEAELGQELLDRSGRQVRPTAAGEAVLPYARAALAAVRGVRQAVDEVSGLLRGQVAVGTVTSYGELPVPQLLADFHARHPHVAIALREDVSERLLGDVRDGRLDLAVAATAGDVPAGVGAQTVLDTELAAAVAPGDPLAGRRTLTVAELIERELVCLPRGTGIREALERAAGGAARVAYEAGDPRVVADLAERGLGVAVLPRPLAESRPGLRAVALTRPTPRARLVLAWRADGPVSPAARALTALAREHLTSSAVEGARSTA
jgi:DNA-binding transcriptional LysR family regulator